MSTCRSKKKKVKKKAWREHVIFLTISACYGGKFLFLKMMSMKKQEKTKKKKTKKKKKMEKRSEKQERKKEKVSWDGPP